MTFIIIYHLLTLFVFFFNQTISFLTFINHFFFSSTKQPELVFYFSYTFSFPFI